MLHLFAFTNFQSFLERTEVSLRLTDKSAARGWDTESKSGQRLTLALATLGANAAGKTSLLKPLAFISWFIQSSFTQLKPEDPVPLLSHFASQGAPSEFEVEAEDEDGVLWRYVLHATNQQVLHEALYRKKDRFSYVFVRDWDEERNTYVIKQKDFGLGAAEAQKVRKNASLIATAVQYEVQVASHIAGIKLFTNLDATGREYLHNRRTFDVAAFFAANETLQNEMRRLLKSWDLGLSDVRIAKHTVAPSEPTQSARTFWYPVGVHQVRGGDVHEIPFVYESRGTQAAFLLLSLLLPALATGGIALVDEFENDLHPLMLEPILDLFARRETNPKNAQIIFTCHSERVLNLLHKAQVMLVEKSHCESHAWRLDTVQGVRSDDNFAAKYTAGAYGAVPRVL
ncbi:hypothetical protein SAMN05518854_103128 [Variovorax sp. YR266]|uniref:AAA family ATPase n=1 Tax=Variovorax sp. YR266 TaxID=1884386 RepID=UPI00089CDEC2|nr:ATP-binding protein [Variovorax sp. YR266]SDY97675.1 hypothetical protein SAMN05518854_103128 [Variovorax sp. YR266]